MIVNKLAVWKAEWNHLNDCDPRGCPYHKAIFTYHSVTESFTLDFGDGTLIDIDDNQMELVKEYIDALAIDNDDYDYLPQSYDGGEFYK